LIAKSGRQMHASASPFATSEAMFWTSVSTNSKSPSSALKSIPSLFLTMAPHSSASETAVNVVIFLPTRSDSDWYGLSLRTAITARAML
jgi:hypothetical protein